MEERCRERKEEILATHKPVPPTEGEERIIAEVLAAARKELAG